MLRAQYRYPIVSGAMLAQYRVGLASWSSLLCGPERAESRRALALREDGGPDSLGVAVWSYGVNVWADSTVDAKNITLDAAAVTLTIPGLVPAVKAIRDLVGPYEVEDEPAYTYGGKSLAHFYFSFDAVVKAVAV